LAQRVKDLMQLRKDRYKALIKHVNKVNTLALEQLAPIVEINRTYRFGLPLGDMESIVDDAANWENNLTLIAYETARNIWPKDYQEVPLSEFDISNFLYDWDDRLKDVYQAGNDKKNYYCFCRGKDYGSKMICCDKCDAWYHCECINMKAEDTPNYEHWYCAMCRAPRTARIKIDESVRRIEALAYETKNLRINLPCISSSFIVEINAELKRMVSGDDMHSVRIGVGLGFGVPLDGSVEDGSEDDIELIVFNLKKHIVDNVDSRSLTDNIDSRRHIENVNLRQCAEDIIGPRKRKWVTDPVEKRKRK
jgi:hypothetical protein